MAHHFSKLNTYTTAMAHSLHERRAARVGVCMLVLRPVVRFCRMFLLKGGWQEGLRGFVIASLGAFYVFAKYAKLWERQCSRQQSPEEGPNGPRACEERTHAPTQSRQGDYPPDN